MVELLEQRAGWPAHPRPCNHGRSYLWGLVPLSWALPWAARPLLGPGKSRNPVPWPDHELEAAASRPLARVGISGTAEGDPYSAVCDGAADGVVTELVAVGDAGLIRVDADELAAFVCD